MNNLHRELAPISDAAWSEIEDEARRTFKLHLAGRRVVDLAGPSGTELAAVGTGHVQPLASPGNGVRAFTREARHIVELRVPFTLDRQSIDDVLRGSNDSDWQPVKDAARTMALTEDRAVFDGWEGAGITGIRSGASTASVALPERVEDYPDAVSRALTALRLEGVGGPYALLLGADAYTEVNETSNHGYPVREHVARVLSGGEIVWAPAIEGAVLLSTRGGDFTLHLGQDLSIGYESHDASTVHLYLTESLTFSLYSPEAAVTLTAAAS